MFIGLGVWNSGFCCLAAS